MTVQTDLAPDLETTDNGPSVRRKRHLLPLLAVIVAMAFAAVAGVFVTAYLTRPAANSGTVYTEPNANTREGRVTKPEYREPNSNEREGRVSGNG